MVLTTNSASPSQVRFIEVQPDSVTVRTEPLEARPLRPGEARVAVVACGICGTDLHLREGMRLPPGAEYPVRPGHEVSGRVIELAADVVASATTPAVGDLVVLHPVAPCGDCDTCDAGLDQLCPEGKVLGLHEPGGLADQVVWRADRMVTVRGVPAVQAAVLADAVATAYRGVKATAISDGDQVCVLGAGGVGTHVMELISALHPNVKLLGVTGTERSAARLRAAGYDAVPNSAELVRTVLKQYGSFDHVFEFSGIASAPAQGARLLKRGGTLVFGSVLEGNLDLGPAQMLQVRELTVKGVFNSSIADLREVVALAESGRLDLSHSVSHTADLADAPTAFQTLAERPQGLVRMVLTTSHPHEA